MEALSQFMNACNSVARMVAQHHYMSPAADLTERKLRPAATLQDSGEVSVRPPFVAAV